MTQLRKLLAAALLTAVRRYDDPPTWGYLRNPNLILIPRLREFENVTKFNWVSARMEEGGKIIYKRLAKILVKENLDRFFHAASLVLR